MYRGINKGVSGLKCHIFIYFVYVWVGGVHAPRCTPVCGWCACTSHVWEGGVCAPWCTRVDGWCACTVVHTCGWWCAYTRVHTCGWVVCIHQGAHVWVGGVRALWCTCGGQRTTHRIYYPSTMWVPEAAPIIRLSGEHPTCWAIMPAQVTGFKGTKKMRCLHCFIKSSSESY